MEISSPELRFIFQILHVALSRFLSFYDEGTSDTATETEIDDGADDDGTHKDKDGTHKLQFCVLFFVTAVLFFVACVLFVVTWIAILIARSMMGPDAGLLPELVMRAIRTIGMYI